MKAVDRKFKRRCVACGVYAQKTQLLRVFRTQAQVGIMQEYCIFPGTMAIPVLPSASGRSAYICDTPPCKKRAIQQQGRLISGALKRPVRPQTIEQIILVDK